MRPGSIKDLMWWASQQGKTIRSSSYEKERVYFPGGQIRADEKINQISHWCQKQLGSCQGRNWRDGDEDLLNPPPPPSGEAEQNPMFLPVTSKLHLHWRFVAAQSLLSSVLDLYFGNPAPTAGADWKTSSVTMTTLNSNQKADLWAEHQAFFP